VPELPDIEAYRYALNRVLAGHSLLTIQINHPFLLRSVEVAPEEAVEHDVVAVERLGKRIAIRFENEVALVFHLMIAGRFRWKEGAPADPGIPVRSASPDEPVPPRGGTPAPGAPAGRSSPARRAKSTPLALLRFDCGTLSLTEAGSKRRASLHVVRGREALAALNPGGLELLEETATADQFAEAIRRENHTLKRSLTDPRLFSGIGNSYSDEILFAAGLSPFAMSQSLTDEEAGRLYGAAVEILREWRDRLLAEAEDSFPTKVTAFRPEMHVHGKYGEPCDVCGTPVQRIRYAENECNYCPTCQTGGRVYADRALSRLLKGDWPRTVEELEKLSRPPAGG
jgi:formamidopyrimidine-DNA glycosylase